MLDGLRLALTTLTVAPLRGPHDVDRRTAGRAMELAPAVGFVLGILAGLVVFTSRLLSERSTMPLLPAVLAVVTLAVLTRGLHLDGLADLFDGLGSYRDPEGARQVMKEPGVGALGMVAVVLCLAVQVAALSACIGKGHGTASLVEAVMTGRLAITWACRDTAPASPDGLGALVARTVRAWVPLLWTVGLAAFFAWYATVDPDEIGPHDRAGARAAIAVVLALAAAVALRRHAVRRLGGISGDVLGALSEVATAVCLVVLATGLTPR